GASALLLYEGNDTSGVDTDHERSHGNNAGLYTFFRNRYTGQSTGLQDRPPVQNSAFNRFNSYIGNVLGAPGQFSEYEYSTNIGTAGGNLYAIGFADGYAPLAGYLDDPITTSSMLRWGNFDYVTNGVRWSTTEIPRDNFVPSTQTLPASFYLVSKPAWFGSVAFPVIGPDVTGGTDSSGHAKDNPAKSCYLNVMKGPSDGTGGLLTFNAAN